MIQDAPYCPDPTGIIRSAPLTQCPLLLTSNPDSPGPLNRYSIFSAWPSARILATDADSPILIHDFEIPGTPRECRSFKEAIGELLATLDGSPFQGHLSWATDDPPFTGGLAGYLSYEFGRHFEVMPSAREQTSLPALSLCLYTSLYVADHLEKCAWWIDRKRPGCPKRADAVSHGIREWITPHLRGGPGRHARRGSTNNEEGETRDWRDGWQSSLTAEEYRKACHRIQRYLREGDIYQANLTVRYRRAFSLDPSNLFLRLLEENPAPFGAMISLPEGQVLSSSPELLADVAGDGHVQTRPIKGTIRSGKPGQDSGPSPGVHGPEVRRLLTSEKDRAEHLMIVDLERNDLGKICRPGSIHVDPLFAVEKYRGLYHLVSSVKGQLRPGLESADVLAAIFPGGSITGAPKIRAMEIIHELEPVPRGVYTGAIGWISPEGEMRMNLAIRTLALSDGLLDLHVGGGIVADSDPDLESEECRLKGEAMARAVRLAVRDARKTRAPA